MRELARRCGAMDARYKPAMWIGDNRNNAADSFIRELADIEETEIADLQLGDFPAIEALAFAVIEMRNHYPPEKPVNLDAPRDGDQTDLAGSYSTRSVFDYKRRMESWTDTAT